MSKKLSIVLLVIALILASGCATPPAATPAPAVPTAVPVVVTEAPVVATKAPAPTAVPTVPPTAQPEKKYVIGLMTIASHPSLELIKKGVIDALKEAGFEEGKNVEFIDRNAEGEIATLTTIAQQFLDEKVDLIVATSTPAMQAAYNVTKDLQSPPVFFNAVSNPYAGGVATSPTEHPAWMIGNQLQDPVEQTIGLVLEINPEARVIGIVYNPAEANATYLLDLAQKGAEKLGLTIETATVSNSSEVQVAAESLVGRGIDAFMQVNDNTVVSGFAALVKVANDNDLLLVGTSASMPGLGAAASYGVNPYEEGLDSGRLIAQYLKGEVDIATATIQIQDAVVLTVNPAGAAEQNVTLPEDLLKRADKTIE